VAAVDHDGRGVLRGDIGRRRRFARRTLTQADRSSADEVVE
jgi:hypothetical protein